MGDSRKSKASNDSKASVGSLDVNSDKSYALMKSQNELLEKNVKNLSNQIKRMNKELEELYHEKNEVDSEV